MESEIERISLRGDEKTEKRDSAASKTNSVLGEHKQSTQQQPGFQQRLGGRYTWVISCEDTSPRDRTS